MTTMEERQLDAAEADPASSMPMVEIVWNGVVFTVPKDRNEWSVESELAVYEARATNLSRWWMRWIELALGPAQYDRLLDGTTLRNRGDLLGFIQHFSATVRAECDS